MLNAKNPKNFFYLSAPKNFYNTDIKNTIKIHTISIRCQYATAKLHRISKFPAIEKRKKMHIKNNRPTKICDPCTWIAKSAFDNKLDEKIALEIDNSKIWDATNKIPKNNVKNNAWPLKNYK